LICKIYILQTIRSV